jgi:hypothetical protein
LPASKRVTRTKATLNDIVIPAPFILQFQRHCDGMVEGRKDCFFPNVHRRFWREKNKNWTDRLVPRGDFVLQQNKEICTTFLHLSLRPSRLVGCHFAWLLDPALSSLVAAPPGDAFCHTTLVRLVCRIAQGLGLSYEWLSCCLSSRRCLLCVYASHS